MEGGITISTYELPWFKWNDVDAKTYGVQILTLPPIETTPIERTNEVTIPGRSGTLTITEGDDIYDKISLSCSCIIEDTSKIASFCGWMKGAGKAKFSNRSDGYYKARVANQISFDKVLRGYDLRSFSIQLSAEIVQQKSPRHRESFSDWDGWTRTSECGSQSPVPYHLATPHRCDPP